MWFAVPSIFDLGVCFEFVALLRLSSGNNGDDDKIFVLSFDVEVGCMADLHATDSGGVENMAICKEAIRC